VWLDAVFGAREPIGLDRLPVLVKEDCRMNMGVGIAIGVALGVAIGAMMDNIGVGIAIGVAIGIALAAAFNKGGSRK
jgi:hypothetical protein